MRPRLQRGMAADRARTQQLGEAWANPGAWRGTSNGAGVDLPNEVWGKIALTELVVHDWDLAKATGQPFGLPEETLRACFDHVAEFVPNAPVEGLWGAAAEVPADAPRLDWIVDITGRNPKICPDGPSRPRPASGAVLGTGAWCSRAARRFPNRRSRRIA